MVFGTTLDPKYQRSEGKGRVQKTLNVSKKELDIVSEPVEETIEETKKGLEITNETFDCVIVVGAFTENANKETVKTKLMSLGYSPAEGVLRQGLHYIGVPVDCSNKKEKRRLLSELNATFDIDSWVKKR